MKTQKIIGKRNQIAAMIVNNMDKIEILKLVNELAQLKAEDKSDWCDFCGEKHSGFCSDHAKKILKAEAEVSDEDIENESQKVIINYLTHNNPNGDFKESTIGADDKRIWWCKGAKAMRDGLIKKG